MKKIIAGVVALTIAFGGLALPAAEGGLAGAAVSASAEEMSEDYAANEEISPDDGEAYIAEQSGEDVQVAGAALTYGDYNYTVLDDGTVEISKYIGSSKKVNIPSKLNGKKVTSIGEEAFVDYVEDTGTSGDHCFGLDISSVVIPEGVTNIGDDAFCHCVNLKSITVPSTVTNFGYNAFCATPWFEAQKANKTFFILNNVLIDGSNAEGDITIPDGVTKIAGGAFEYNDKITNVNFPDSVTVIGAAAFCECVNLTHIVLPKKLTYLDGLSFRNCDKLVTIVIPKTVKYIGIMCLEQTYKMKKVYYTGSKSDWEKIEIDPTQYWLYNDRVDIISYNYDYSQPILDVKAPEFDPLNKAIKYTWIPAPDADGYKIYVYNTSTKKWENKVTVRDGKATSCTIKNLKAGTEYDLRIRAYAKRNGKTYWGDYDRGSAITLAASPVIKSTSSTKNSITLKWGKVKSADGYRVYKYDSKTKKWKTLATVKNGKTSYVDKKSLKSKTTYKYKVKAYHKWGPDYNKVNVWGLASAVKSVKTK